MMILAIAWSRELIRSKKGLISVMVGRKRKMRARGATGRLKQTYINPKAQVTAQPHRRAVPVQFRERVEAESEFGRLMLNGRITPAQYEAGTRYRDIVIQMRRTYDAPSPDPRAIDWHRLGGMAPDMPPERSAAIREAYNRAFEALGTAGNKALRAVNAHAVFDSRVRDLAIMPLLTAGLDALIRHYGVDPGLQLRTISTTHTTKRI